MTTPLPLTREALDEMPTSVHLIVQEEYAQLHAQSVAAIDLQAEVTRLREALEKIDWETIDERAMYIAREALAGEGDKHGD